MAQEHDMINPTPKKQVSAGVISYGVSSYGYDLRVSGRIQNFHQREQHHRRPETFLMKTLVVTVNADVAIIPPNSFALARSVEYFKIPRDVLTILRRQVHLRSRGIIVNRNALRAGVGRLRHARDFQHQPLPAKIYANEGLCQILFFQSDEGVRGELQGPQGEVPVAEGDRTAEALGSQPSVVSSQCV